MPVNTDYRSPFIPQEGITAQILQGIQMANEQHVRRQQLAIQQQQAQSEGTLQAAQTGNLQAQTQAGLPAAQAHAALAKANLDTIQAQIEQANDPLNRAILKGKADMADVELKHANLSLQLLQGLANGPGPQGMADAAVKSFKGVSGDEQAQLDAAVNADKSEMAYGKPPSHVSGAVNEIANNRRSKAVAELFTAGRGANIVHDYFNTEKNEIQTLNMTDYNNLPKEERSKYVEFTPTISNTLKAQSNVNDIRDGIKRMSDVLNSKDFVLSDAGRTIMAAAQKDPTILNSAATAEAMKTLNPQERDFFTAAQTLTERAMSLRGLQGQGAGSDAQREAIVRLLPSIFDPDAKMSQQRLRDFQNNVDNVDRGIPAVGNSKKSASSQQQQNPTQGSADEFSKFGGRGF